MENLTCVWNSICEGGSSAWKQKDAVLQAMGVSFVGSAAVHTNTGGITEGIAYGCMAAFKTAFDAVITPLYGKTAKPYVYLPGFHSRDVNIEAMQEFVKRCAVDFLISAAFSSVFHPKHSAPLTARVVFHAFISYSMGKERRFTPYL